MTALEIYNTLAKRLIPRDITTLAIDPVSSHYEARA